MSEELINMYGCDISAAELYALNDALQTPSWDLITGYLHKWQEYEKDLLSRQSDTTQIFRGQGKIRQLEKLLTLKEMTRVNIHAEKNLTNSGSV